MSCPACDGALLLHPCYLCGALGGYQTPLPPNAPAVPVPRSQLRALLGFRELWMRQRCPVCGFERSMHLDAVMPGEVWADGFGLVPCATLAT